MTFWKKKFSKIALKNGGTFVLTLTTSQVCPWAHPDPSYHSCSRMMWGWSTLKGFYWPRSFQCELHLRKGREVFSAELTKSEGISFRKTTMEDFPFPRGQEERKHQNALCEGDVNRCATPPSKACTSPINTSPRLPSSGFPHINSSFFWCHPKSIRPFNTNSTANSRCPIGRPPQTKSTTSHQPHRTCRVFFCLHLLWSVFRQQRHAGKWWHLQLEWPLYSKDCPAGDEHRASTDDELNLSIWAVLLQYQFSPHVSIILSHLGSVFHVIQPGT